MNNKGRIIRTVCFPMYLQNIVDKLSEQRKLSETLSQLLWDIYGDDDISEEEAIINSMKLERDRLMAEIEKKEKEINHKASNSKLKKMLSYLESWLAEYHSCFIQIKQAVKRGHYAITNENKDKIAKAKATALEYGKEEAFVETYQRAAAEKTALLRYIKNPSDIPSEWDGYNNNNNNNIYYLINYYYIEDGKSLEVNF